MGILLLIVYSTTALNSYQTNKYRQFLHQHRNQRMTTNDCNDVMRDRQITQSGSNDCKWTNTFITLATVAQIRAVCTGGQNIGGNLFRSTTPFTIVICRLINGKPNHPSHPNCQYQGSTPRLASYIVIACDARYPMHFERHIG